MTSVRTLFWLFILFFFAGCATGEWIVYSKIGKTTYGKDPPTWETGVEYKISR